MIRLTSLSHTLLLGISICLLSCTHARAQTPVIPNPISIAANTTSKDAHAFLQLVRVQNACKLPLNLKVQNTSIEEVATRVQKKLAESSDPFIKSLPVQVRNVRPARLSFSTKNSTIGRTLGSVATIGGAKLWAFTDHLLIAPDEALTQAEKEEQGKGLSDAWKTSDTFHDQFWDTPKQKAFTSFITDELKAGLANGVLPSSADKNHTMLWDTTDLMGPTTWSQLSPDAQEMLKEMVSMSSERFQSNSPMGAPSITANFDLSTATIGINPRSNNSVAVLFADTSQLEWRMDGSSGYASPHPNFPKPTSNKAPAPPFTDPSAGKS